MAVPSAIQAETCGLCGAKKKVRKVREKVCCATCEHIWRAAHVSSGLLVDALNQARGPEYLAEKVGVAVPADYDDMKRRLHAMEQLYENMRLALGCQGDEAALESVIRLVKERDAALDELVKVREALNISEQQAARLEDELRHASLDEDGERRRLQDENVTIVSLREMLDIGQDESIIEAVHKLQREMKKAIDTYYDLGKVLDLAVGDNILDKVMKLVLELQELKDLSDGSIMHIGVNEDTNPGEYQSLRRVLDLALDQAANGKGKERHADPGEPFERQKICEIARRVGLAFPIGQAIKKAEESVRLGVDAGIRENLGAINYLAAAVIVMEERAGGQ